MFMKSLITCLLTATTLCALPQAVIFDFGGVMTGESNREAVVDFLCESFQLSKDEFQLVNSRKREAVKGGMTDEAFWLTYAAEQNIILPLDWVSQFKDAMRQAINPSQNMYELVDELKNTHLKVGMLSNIDTRLANIVRDFGLYQPFHPCILSCDIGVEKPDERAYKILLSSLHLPANQVVFIDDKKENVCAAKCLCIDAILFESYEQIKEELENRGLLSSGKKVFW